MEEDQENSSLNSVVARANALMQRRRQPSPAAENEDLPVLTEVVDPDADLPVLLDEASSLSEIEETTPASPNPAAVDILAHELARRLGERLAAEIPNLVATVLQSAVAGVTDELHRGLAESTEVAIRDFLVKREKSAKTRPQD